MNLGGLTIHSAYQRVACHRVALRRSCGRRDLAAPGRARSMGAPALFLAACCLLVPLRAVGAPAIAWEHIDGATERGQWVGLRQDDDSASVMLRVEKGEQTEDIPLSDLLALHFSTSPADVAQGVESLADGQRPHVFHLADGSQFVAAIDASTKDGLRLTTSLKTDQSIQVPLSGVRAVRVRADQSAGMEKAATIFGQELAAPRLAEDVLITRDAEAPRVLTGAIVSLDAEGGEFRFGERTRRFNFDKVFGVVFGTGGSPVMEAPALVEQQRGGVIGGAIIPAADGGSDSLTVRTSFGETIVLPLPVIDTVRLANQRVVRLSDLTPANMEHEGRLHRDGIFRRDEGLRGEALRLGGREYARGLMVRSGSRLTYAIDGSFQRFVVTVGIAEAVRPRGCVVCRVLGDGRALAETGLITGRDGATRVDIDVTGVKTLTLVTDFGDGLDLADLTIWADGRLIKPLPAKPNS